MTRAAVRELAILSALLVLLASVLAGVARANHSSNQLDICCAWNGTLADGVLTYRISGGPTTPQPTLRAAVEEWDSSLPALALTEVAAKAAADIEIKFKTGGGTVAGQTLRKFDRDSFVQSVNLTISGGAFGLPHNVDTIAEITRHEMGHALGLGHANFDDLMDPTVGGSSQISACDLQGVVAANHWKLADNVSQPHQPHVTHVAC